jgi:hypothetical protein
MHSLVAGLVGAAALLATSPVAAQPGASRASSTRAAAAAAVGSARARAASTPPAPGAVPAPRVALAERHAEEAFQAYGRKDYANAVALYLKALDAAPSADIVYNLARVYDIGLRDRALAKTFYTRYLGEPGAVANRIEMARQRLAELDAAESSVKGPAVASATDAAPPAPHAVTSSPMPRPAREAAAQGGSALPALALTAGALGLVGMGVGVGFGITAKSHLDVSRRYCNDNSCTTLRGVEAARSAARAADVATVGFVAGGGLLALGTVLWLVADGEAESHRSPRELEWTPSLAPGEVSLALSGSFAGP